MIYLENTTDTQTIFIDREIQSIENITPITLDSNYYTKTETNEQIANSLNQAKRYTDTEVLKLDAELENINEDIDVLEERIIDLENNGGGSSTDNNTHFIDEEKGELDYAQFYDVIDRFKNGQRVILETSDGDVNIVCVDNRSIVGISTDECIITWSNTYPLERIDKRIYNVSITNRDLQTEINTTNRRIDEVERVRVLDVSNGMTAEQFNTIFNNFKTINYKYLLNIGNNDLFNICSIQQANRSITAMGFDDYEGEIMCYTWFAPQQSSTPELTKRKITTEIV